MTPRRLRHAGLRELGIFALAYLTYFGVRAITEGRPRAAVDNAIGLFDVERALGVDSERLVQDAILDNPTVVDAANALDIWGHWPLLIVGGIPVAPPRLAGSASTRSRCTPRPTARCSRRRSSTSTRRCRASTRAGT